MQGVKEFAQISPNLVQFAAALSAHSFCLTMGPLFVGKQGCYRKPTLYVSLLSYYCSKNHQSCVPRVILDMNNTLLLWLMKQEMNLQLQPKTQAILKFHRNELLLLLLDEDNDDDSIITDFELYNSNSHLPGTLKQQHVTDRIKAPLFFVKSRKEILVSSITLFLYIYPGIYNIQQEVLLLSYYVLAAVVYVSQRLITAYHLLEFCLENCHGIVFLFFSYFFCCLCSTLQCHHCFVVCFLCIKQLKFSEHT